MKHRGRAVKQGDAPSSSFPQDYAASDPFFIASQPPRRPLPASTPATQSTTTTTTPGFPPTSNNNNNNNAGWNSQPSSTSTPYPSSQYPPTQTQSYPPQPWAPPPLPFVPQPSQPPPQPHQYSQFQGFPNGEPLPPAPQTMSIPNYVGMAAAAFSSQTPPAQMQQMFGGQGAATSAMSNLAANPLVYAAVTEAASQMANQQVQTAAMNALSFWGTLRNYFGVDNSFVVRKLGVLLFPFLKKDWSRAVPPTSAPLAPKADPNSPDLYIPLMALSTYVLTVGLARGSAMKFDPEDIVNAFGSSFSCQVFQICLMKLALALVGPWAPPVGWLDMMAMTGYEFVGVAINMLVGVTLGATAYNISLLYTSLAIGFVTFQNLAVAVPPPEPGQRGRKRRKYFLAACVVLQAFVMWFLGFTRDLKPSAVIWGGVSMAINKSSASMSGGKTSLDEAASSKMDAAKIIQGDKDASSASATKGRGKGNADEEDSPVPQLKRAAGKRKLIEPDDDEEEDDEEEEERSRSRSSSNKGKRQPPPPQSSQQQRKSPPAKSRKQTTDV